MKNKLNSWHSKDCTEILFNMNHPDSYQECSRLDQCFPDFSKSRTIKARFSSCGPQNNAVDHFMSYLFIKMLLQILQVFERKKNLRTNLRILADHNGPWTGHWETLDSNNLNNSLSAGLDNSLPYIFFYFGIKTRNGTLHKSLA